MSEPNISVGFTARMLLSEACSAGDALVYDSVMLAPDGTPGVWRVSTAANRATANAVTQGIALTDYGGALIGLVSYQSSGVVAQEISGLPVLTPSAATSLVRVSTAGLFERIASYTAGDDIIGYASSDGRVALHIGLPWQFIASAGGISVSAGDGVRVTNTGSAYTVHGVRGTCSPEQFGAVGDDMTSDATAFTAAFAALAAGTYHTLDCGARHYYAPGVSLSVPAGCSLFGQGAGATQIRTDTNNALIVIGGEGVEIGSLTLRGSSSGSSQHLIKDGTTGVSGSGHSKVKIHHVDLINAGGNGFDYQENPLAIGAAPYLGPSLDSVRASGCVNGFNFGNRGEYVTMNGCQSELSTGWGYLIGAGNVQCVGCMSAADHSGVWVTDGANGGHNQWSGGAVNHPGTGNSFQIDTSLGYKVVGCAIYASLNGINLTTSARGILVASCQIDSGSIQGAANVTARFIDNTYVTTSITLTFDPSAQIEFEGGRNLSGKIPAWLGAYQTQTFAFPSDASQTLSVSVSCAQEIILTTGSLASDGKTLRLGLTPDAGRRKLITNSTSHSVNVAWSTGTAYTLAAGLSMMLGADGTNARKVIAESSVSVPGTSGEVLCSDGSGTGMLAATSAVMGTGGTPFFALGTSPASVGLWRAPASVAQLIVCGTQTVLAATSTDVFLGCDSSFGNLATNLRIMASGIAHIGLSGNDAITIQASLVQFQRPSATAGAIALDGSFVYIGLPRVGNNTPYASEGESLITGGSGVTTTLTPAQYANKILKFTGYSGTCTVNGFPLPATEGASYEKTIRVGTGGGSITFAMSAGTTYTYSGALAARLYLTFTPDGVTGFGVDSGAAAATSGHVQMAF